ncbi:MAG: triphosphoribosyl-dephospho-CoA synthase [Desulfovibrio sp.]|jgi:hypothetical protein|nr:triphosphoribosyl-dephospho-CoA synthase [Desulfovibrio sp.]
MKSALSALTPGTLRTDMIAAFALRAALHEAAATEKPGLVCPDTAGVHTDMDIQTMVASAVSLYPCFRNAAVIGMDTAGLEARAAFSLLRGEGREAERAMFAVTCGVNTHKGLIFSMGLFCAAMEIVTDTDRVSVSVPLPVGEPENPAPAELYAAKFDDLAAPVWNSQRRKAILKAVGKLEQLEDMRELTRLLAAS